MNLFKKLFNWNRKERDEKLEILSKKLDVVIKHQENEKCVKNRIKVGTNTVIVFNDGNSLTCDDPDNTFYDYCGVETNRDYIDFAYNLHVNKEEKKQSEVILEKDFLILQNNPDFVINGKKVYLSGINIPISDDILAEFIVNREEYLAKSPSFNMSDREQLEKLDDYYNRLIFFWAKLANSPVKDRDNVMTFLRDNDVRISKYGNIIAYRNVVTWKKEEVNPVMNVKLQDFVNEEYNKIVKKWKKKASDYTVGYNQKEYKLFKNGQIADIEWVNCGNLADLKAQGCEIKEEIQLYTSFHNRGKYVFPIPSLYKIDESEIDPNTENCSSGGIHAAHCHWNYTGFGDSPVVVLVNPAKSLYVPKYDSGKFRTTEMYIACINPNEHGHHIDESLIEEADKIYNDMTVEQLKEAFASKSMETLSIDDENVPETSLKDVSNIISILSERVVNI